MLSKTSYISMIRSSRSRLNLGGSIGCFLGGIQ